MTTIGFDCLTIPGAAKNTANNKGLPEQFCGRNLIDATADPFSGKKDTKKFVTVCCKCRNFFFKKNCNISLKSQFFLASRTPFSVRFLSDHWEYATDAMHEAVKPGKGIRLAYSLENCGA